jgi:hypothetical protein
VDESLYLALLETARKAGKKMGRRAVLAVLNKEVKKRGAVKTYRQQLEDIMREAEKQNYAGGG